MTQVFKKHAAKIFPAMTLLALVAVVAFVQPGSDWIAPRAVSAQVSPAPWTAIGASGTVDETSLPNFAFVNASAGYLSTGTSTASLQFRYNVTNTYDNATNPRIPGWTTLELGAVAPATSFVNANLYRVARCTGKRTFICQARVTNSTTGICRNCTFTNTTINFTSDLYYVDVIVDRGTVSESPLIHTLRIY